MYGRFEELQVWQRGREFRNEIYAITKGFPGEEMFGLTSQIRRAAVSLTSNIAEGHGRYHYRENIQFCKTSRGSLNEMLDHLYLAMDMGYIGKDRFMKLYEKGREFEKILNGYIKYLQGKTKSCGKEG